MSRFGGGVEEEVEGAPEDAFYHSISSAAYLESSVAPRCPSSPESGWRPAMEHLQQVTSA